MNTQELNVNEMEQVNGGSGGSRNRLYPTQYYDVYRIQKGDNLTAIARRYRTTVNYLYDINPTITNINDITAGYYIYVPYLTGNG